MRIELLEVRSIRGDRVNIAYTVSTTVRVCQRMRTCVTKCVVSSVPGGTRYGIQSVRTQCTGLESQLTHAIYITILQLQITFKSIAFALLYHLLTFKQSYKQDYPKDIN